MIGFKYEYITSSEIMNNIKLLSEYSIIESLILSGILILFIIIILYITPLINLYFSFRKKDIDKKNRKQMIKQIAIQKDINDEIEKELNI